MKRFDIILHLNEVDLISFWHLELDGVLRMVSVGREQSSCVL